MPNTNLKRTLSLTAAIMVVAGSMIGSGIFRKPATMAGQLLSPELLLLVWVAAGLITFMGALSNAEVAGMIDATGGQYVYFQKMYGKFFSFLYGWSVIAVIQSGSQAAIAYVFGEYIGYFIHYPQAPDWLKDISLYMPFVGNIFPFNDIGPKFVAILSIIFLTIVNYIGVMFGGVVQTVVTYIKIISIVALALLLLIFGSGNLANLVTDSQLSHNGQNIFIMIGLALSGAFWAYDGWNNVTFISGEIKNPQINVPKALLTGTLIVMFTYVLINAAYLYILPIDEMSKSPLVAASAIEKLFGTAGGAIISIAVIISTFGALNGSLLASARVPFAMAREKLFFKRLGDIHPKYATPHVSLVVQGIWSAVLVLSGSFDTISDYVIFATWLFYLLGAYGVIVLRKKMPDVNRPYKVWGYPYTTFLFIIFAFVFLLNSLISDTQNAAMGLILIFSGVPFYFYYRKKSD